MQLALGGYFLAPAGRQTLTDLTPRAGATRVPALHTLLLQTLLRGEAFYSSPAACAWTIATAAQSAPQPLTPAQLPARPAGPALYRFCWLGQPWHLPDPPPLRFPLPAGDILALLWSLTPWAAHPVGPDPALLIAAFPEVPPPPPGLLPIGPPLLLCEWPLHQPWTAARMPFAPTPPAAEAAAAWRQELVLRYLAALWEGVTTAVLTLAAHPADATTRTRLAPLQPLMDSHLVRTLEVQVITPAGENGETANPVAPRPL
jgi:hypothetical protein